MLSNLIQIFELATIVLPVKKEEIKPKKMVKKKKLTKEEKKEQERLQTLMDNIDNYNGDGIGQKEVK